MGNLLRSILCPANIFPFKTSNALSRIWRKCESFSKEETKSATLRAAFTHEGFLLTIPPNLPHKKALKAYEIFSSPFPASWMLRIRRCSATRTRSFDPHRMGVLTCNQTDQTVAPLDKLSIVSRPSGFKVILPSADGFHHITVRHYVHRLYQLLKKGLCPEQWLHLFITKNQRAHTNHSCVALFLYSFHLFI